MGGATGWRWDGAARWDGGACGTERVYCTVGRRGARCSVVLVGDRNESTAPGAAGAWFRAWGQDTRTGPEVRPDAPLNPGVRVLGASITLICMVLYCFQLKDYMHVHACVITQFIYQNSHHILCTYETQYSPRTFQEHCRVDHGAKQ